MSFLAKVGKLDCPASAGAQAITGLGFAPKALVFWLTKLTADGTAGELYQAIGVAAAGNQEWAHGLASQDAVGTSNTGRALSNAACIYLPNVAGSARDLEADLTSLDADGFTLNWTTVISGVDVGYLALGGSDLTNAAVGTGSPAASTGNKAYTGTGFQPDCLILVQSGASTVPQTTTFGSLGLGVAVSPTQRWVTTGLTEDAKVAAIANRRFYVDACYFSPSAAEVVGQLADFVSFDSNGFTLNHSVGASSRVFGWLALKGGHYAAGTITQKTSTGSQATAGLGFPPAAVLFASHGSTVTGANVDDVNLSIGAASGSGAQGVTVGIDNDLADPMEADSASSTASCIQLREAGTAAINAEANLTSLDADGWTLNWSAADATARVVGYLAFGSWPSYLPPNRTRQNALLRM